MKVHLASSTFEEIRKLSEHNPEFLNYYKSHREKVVVSSWHINEYESFAMWQIFTQNSEGLAIQSTTGRLQKALEVEKKSKQYIGSVKYIDYKKNTFLLTICFSHLCLNVKVFNMKEKYESFLIYLIVNFQLMMG